jgi:hypothetical protein
MMAGAPLLPAYQPPLNATEPSGALETLSFSSASCLDFGHFEEESFANQ